MKTTKIASAVLALTLAMGFSTLASASEAVSLDVTDDDSGFACIVTQDGDIYWEMGTDSCTDLLKKSEVEGEYVSIHVIPDNDHDYPYLYPDEDWIMLVYGEETPDWVDQELYDNAWAAFEEWKEGVYSIFDYEGLLTVDVNDTLEASPEEGYKGHSGLEQLTECH